MAPVFDDELAAADAYARTFALGDLGAKPTRRLAVLTCMDTRIDPLRIFGLEPGEAAVLRNAGARIDEAAAAALAVARDRLDVDRVIVLGHTDCRGTDDASKSVTEDVARIGSSLEIALGGFVYDVASGRVTPV